MIYKPRIKEIARESSMTLSSIAKKLGITRFNMSAIASGARGVSLRVLLKITRILDCDIDELIDNKITIFKDKKLQSLMEIVENRSFTGQDKSWVHRVMLAHHIHYQTHKKV